MRNAVTELVDLEVIPHLGVFTSASRILPLELCQVFQAIAMPPDLMRREDYWASELGNALVWSRRYILGEFIRRDFASDFPLWRPDRTMLREVQAHAKLWSAVWRMMERLEGTYGFMLPGGPVLHPWPFKAVFATLVHYETGGLLSPHASYREPGIGGGATAIARTAQTDNAKLLGLENPFRGGTFSAQIVDEAISWAGKHDRFRQDFYYPVARTRSALMACLKEVDPVKVDNAKHLGQSK